MLRHGAALPAWRPTRLNERYLPALRLAELVLANTGAEVSDGTVQVAGFVVDMAKVFEDLVGTALTESLRRYPGTTRLPYPDHLDEPGAGARAAIPMYVDVVHTVKRRPRLVFDAKYKTEGPSGRYPNADHYQMLAYCTALKVPTAWLVYAGGGRSRVRRIRHPGLRWWSTRRISATSRENCLGRSTGWRERRGRWLSAGCPLPDESLLEEL